MGDEGVMACVHRTMPACRTSAVWARNTLEAHSYVCRIDSLGGGKV